VINRVLCYCVQQSQWLDVLCSQQDGAYDVEMMREEQEILDYSYRELVVELVVNKVSFLTHTHTHTLDLFNGHFSR